MAYTVDPGIDPDPTPAQLPYLKHIFGVVGIDMHRTRQGADGGEHGKRENGETEADGKADVPTFRTRSSVERLHGEQT